MSFGFPCCENAGTLSYALGGIVSSNSMGTGTASWRESSSTGVETVKVPNSCEELELTDATLSAAEIRVDSASGTLQVSQLH